MTMWFLVIILLGIGDAWVLDMPSQEACGRLAHYMNAALSSTNPKTVKIVCVKSTDWRTGKEDK